jgi:hypothetical protein
VTVPWVFQILVPGHCASRRLGPRSRGTPRGLGYSTVPPTRPFNTGSVRIEGV